MNNDDMLILLIIAGFFALFMYNQSQKAQVPQKLKKHLKKRLPKNVERFQDELPVQTLSTPDLTQEDIFVKQSRMCTHIDTIRVGMNPVDAEGIFNITPKSPECDALSRAKFCANFKAPTPELAKKYASTIKTGNENGKSMLYQYEKYGPGCN
jgi:hypothetical protein